MFEFSKFNIVKKLSKILLKKFSHGNAIMRWIASKSCTILARPAWSLPRIDSIFANKIQNFE